MIVEQTDVTTQVCDDMPTITHPHVHCGYEPEYAIQQLSHYAGGWRFWDCAYTRAEADNLLASYDRRYRARGYEWRIARIVYV
jgi:hypothetical protein